MKLFKNKENSKGKKLIKNTIILAIGKFSTQFISFLLLPLYTTYLTTSEYGIVDLITTYIVLLVPVVTLQIEMYVFRFLIDCRKEEIEKRKIISNCYFLVALLLVICIFIFTIISKFIQIGYYIYLLFILITTIFSNILLQTSRGLGDNIGYSLSCIIIAVVNITCVVILLVFGNLGIKAIFIASILSNLFGIMFLFIRNRIYKYISIKCLSKELQREIIKYSFPLVPNGLVWWIIDVSDRTLISIVLGISFNGVYSVSNKVSNIINTFYNIFNMSWTETVAMYIEDNDNFISKTFNMLFKIICSLCLMIISIMFIAFPILIKEEYKDAYNYIPILVIATIFSMLSSNLSAIYVAKKKTKQIAFGTMIASIINILINFIFIKAIGLYAAAISTLISFAILFFIRYIEVKKYVDIKIKKANALFFTMLFIISVLVYFYNNVYLNAILLGVNIMICFIMNKELLLKIKTKLKNKLIKERYHDTF